MKYYTPKRIIESMNKENVKIYPDENCCSDWLVATAMMIKYAGGLLQPPYGRVSDGMETT